MSQWDFIMGKRLRLCHYHAVTQIQSTGKHQGLEQLVILSYLQRASVRCCTYNICHNNGMHIQTHTHAHTHTHIHVIYTHWDGLVVTMSASYAVGCGFVAHHTNGTNCLFA